MPQCIQTSSLASANPESATPITRRSNDSILYIRIILPGPDGTEECISQSQPCKGGCHVSHLLTEIDSLLGQGWTAAQMVGARIENMVDDKIDTVVPVKAGDIEIVQARRARAGLAAPADEDFVLS